MLTLNKKVKLTTERKFAFFTCFFHEKKTLFLLHLFIIRTFIPDKNAILKKVTTTKEDTLARSLVEINY